MSETNIRLVVGLGNPGDEHLATRHNVGWWLVDELARRHGGVFKDERKLYGRAARIGFSGHDVRLLEPITFMNRSGQSLRATMDFLRIPLESVLVVHDDLDLPTGALRLKHGGGHGGHNGLRDIFRHCGQDFARLRIGIGHPGKGRDVVAYVLKKPSAEDQRILEEAVVTGADAVERVITDGLQRAMTWLHTDQ